MSADASNDTKPAAPASAQNHSIRFRAQTADGADLVSELVELKPFPKTKTPVRLSHPHFGAAQYTAGGKAVMSVECLKNDGLEITFHVEKQEGSSWLEVTQLRGKISDGRASVEWQIGELPLGEDASKDGADAPGEETVRFRAELYDVLAESEPAVVKARPSKLDSPEWANAELAHGDDAVMRVKAPGMHGRKVAFIVEQKTDDGHWIPYATVTSVVKGDWAAGRVKVKHPVAHPGRELKATEDEMKKADPAPLRFHCRLVPNGPRNKA